MNCVPLNLVPPKSRRAPPRALPAEYSDAVRSALHNIRRVHREEEAKLELEDRLHLAAALELLAIAALLEAQISAASRQ